ncbi:uncharacterized protein [Miscanthus floridulus]|uniref:uncharacterized protein n=1 Tax=Miscanthus floridulus TaxID=154761 RepID=UPI003457A5D2
MADVVMKIIDVSIAIKEAVDTARTNHKECNAIAKVADHVCGLVQMLRANAPMAMVQHPVVAGTLGSVLDSMKEALELVIRCGKKNIVLQLITAQSTAKKLARVKSEILQKISLGTLAVTVATAVSLSRPQRSVQLPQPVHCRSRVELARMVGVIYNGQWIDMILTLVTPETTTTVALAMRASGAQATFLSGHDNNIMCALGIYLNGVIFHAILVHHGVLGCVIYGGIHGDYETEELCGDVLDAAERNSSSLCCSSPRISEISDDSDAATDSSQALLLGQLAVEGAVIACHAKDEFDAQLAKGNEAGKLVIINFMSPTCGPCQEIAPVFVECAKEYPTAAVFLEVDIHELKEVATIYNIEGTPTFVFIRYNQTMETCFVGASPDKLRNTIKEFIDDAPASASSSA